MFHPTDPRARLAASSAGAAGSTSQFAGASYARFYAEPPQIQTDTEKTWLARGRNFVVAYSVVEAGVVLARPAQVDEYGVILPDRTGAVAITAGAETVPVAAFSVAFVPPGASRIEATEPGRVIRIFSSQSTDLNEACGNAADFTAPSPHVTPFRAWPAPETWAIRAYPLEIGAQAGRFGRIFRCSTVMINFLEPRIGLRDITKLSPHHHDDFEQGSLVVDGGFVHDIRWPWVPDMRAWRNDEHEFLAAPSLTVIPPPAVHTSRSVLPGVNQLIDIFSPPRADFSKQPGWVLNADDYPAPAESA